MTLKSDEKIRRAYETNLSAYNDVGPKRSGEAETDAHSTHLDAHQNIAKQSGQPCPYCSVPTPDFSVSSCPACGGSFGEPNWSAIIALQAEVAKYKAAAETMAMEWHDAINEPMYAGTRRDWIDRAFAAEAEVERLKGELVCLSLLR